MLCIFFSVGRRTVLFVNIGLIMNKWKHNHLFCCSEQPDVINDVTIS